MNRTRTFQERVSRFANLKAKFLEFCAVCSECFSENEHFPGVSFKVGQQGGLLNVFDRTFEVACAPMPETLGVLSVTLRERDKPIPMVRWYFDRWGNVRRELDANWGSDPLTDKDFVWEFVNTISEAYTSRVAAEAHQLSPAGQG